MATRAPKVTTDEESMVVTEDNVPDVPEEGFVKSILLSPFGSVIGELQSSPNTTNLFCALVKAQLEFTTIIKDKLNPHFKSMYADLDSIMKSIRVPLLRNGLLLYGFFDRDDTDVYLVTRITFAPTGEYIQLNYPIVLPANEQQKGSVLTYARRYSICTLLNLSADADDDGNAAASKVAAEVEPLTYSKAKLLEWAATNTPYTHASDEERKLSLDKFVTKNYYDTDSKWKALCIEHRDRYKSESTTEVAA